MKRGIEESSGLREEEQAVRGTSFRVSAHSLGFGGGWEEAPAHPSCCPLCFCSFPNLPLLQRPRQALVQAQVFSACEMSGP